MIEVCSTNKCCRSFAGGEQTPAPAPAPAKWGKTPAPAPALPLRCTALINLCVFPQNYILIFFIHFRFGTFFSPLLSFICLFKLWFIFYVKKVSGIRSFCILRGNRYIYRNRFKTAQDFTSLEALTQWTGEFVPRPYSN